MTYQLTEEGFLREVSSHCMEVVRDDGVNRHIRFRKPGTICYGFDLITWPGHLCYTGDMGTYVFQRTEDMFEFFCMDRKGSDRLYINLGYWSEKLIAVDGGRNGGKAMEFCVEKFKKAINRYRIDWMRSAKERGKLDKLQRRELWEAVENEVIYYCDEDEQYAMQAAHGFNHRISGFEFQFEDLWEHSFDTFTHHFLWCCYALAWGIKQYDASKEMAVPA